LEGREVDDEAMFEKRNEDYVQEKEDIVREYRERGLLVEAIPVGGRGVVGEAL
jgi:hypothetical protein